MSLFSIFFFLLLAIGYCMIVGSFFYRTRRGLYIFIAGFAIAVFAGMFLQYANDKEKENPTTNKYSRYQ